MFSRVKASDQDSFLLSLARKIVVSIVSLCAKIFSKHSSLPGTFQPSNQLLQDLKAPREEMSSALTILSADEISDLSAAHHKRYSPLVFLGIANSLQSMQDGYNDNPSEKFHHAGISDQSKGAFENPQLCSVSFPSSAVIMLNLDADVEEMAYEPGMQVVHQERLISSPLRTGQCLFKGAPLQDKNEVIVMLHLELDDLGCENSDGELQPGMPVRWRYTN
jgi:hypothetical protein